jgi:hypothetical protein
MAQFFLLGLLSQPSTCGLPCRPIRRQTRGVGVDCWWCVYQSRHPHNNRLHQWEIPNGLPFESLGRNLPWCGPPFHMRHSSPVDFEKRQSCCDVFRLRERPHGDRDQHAGRQGNHGAHPHLDDPFLPVRRFGDPHVPTLALPLLFQSGESPLDHHPRKGVSAQRVG